VNLNCFAQFKMDEKSITCDVKMSEEDILLCVPDDIAEKYRRFKENLENPDTRQCSKCEWSQRGDPKNPAIKCEKCGHIYCYTHGDTHPNSSCNDYDRTHRRENLINSALIAKITKPCPKCKSPIQKRSGCNHMKCPKCHASFCWICCSEIEDKPFPDHFKETNITSGCRGKQFGQQENNVGCCGIIIFICLILLVGPPAGLLAVATYLVTLPCLTCCLQERTLANYAGAFRFIFNMWATCIVYFLFFIIGLAFMPCLCFYCCYRQLGGQMTLIADPQDDDDRMARQLEEEAAREVNNTLSREEKEAKEEIV